MPRFYLPIVIVSLGTEMHVQAGHERWLTRPSYLRKNADFLEILENACLWV